MTDTHVIRVSQRLGLADSEIADKLEMELKEVIPEERQIKYSLVIGEHGRAVCKARKPLQDICVICNCA
jgi:endonuclease-3